MDPWQAGAVFAAGVAAGTINTVVGSGTLITVPTLLAIGYPPVTANVSNNIGLVFGGVTGTWGYRRELEGQRGRLRRLVPMSLVGGVAGALLLLRLPPSAFTAIVPALILFSVVLVLVQPRLAVAVQKRRAQAGRPGDHVGVLAMAGTLLAGVYGGYFGAAQGVLLIGILGAVLDESLQRVNAAKNALQLVVNLVAAITFLVVRPEAVDPVVVALIAVGSLIGGVLGARVGRALSPVVLRGVVALVGLVAVVRLLRA
ncbi:MAG: sulfite exporter TauE/SafE family protein [Kineosporiaceae bacterium]